MGIFGLIFIVLPLIIFFIILGIGVTLVHRIRQFLGFGRSNGAAYSRRTDYGSQQQAQSRTSSSSQPSPKKKVIDDDEGEYVEFEEVK